MIRTQVYLSETEYKGLKNLSLQTGRSQSELIRDAIDKFIGLLGTSSRITKLRKGRGIWKTRNDLPNFEEIRNEFNRQSL